MEIRTRVRGCARARWQITIAGEGGGEGDPSRSYAVSAPADRDASRLYYSYRIIKGGGGEILVVVTQCLLLPIGTHHGCTTHTVSLKGWGGGGGWGVGGWVGGFCPKLRNARLGGGGGGRWGVVGVDVVINHGESRSAPTELLVPYC